MYQFPLRRLRRTRTTAMIIIKGNNNVRAQSENFNFIFIALLCIKYLQLFAMSHENEPFSQTRAGAGAVAGDFGGDFGGRVHADKFK